MGWQSALRGSTVDSGDHQSLRDRARTLDQARAAALVVIRGGWCRSLNGRRLFLNLGDRRAIELARKKGCLDHALALAWRALVEQESPEVVVDVGANYGEIVGAVDYPTARHIVLIEPNPVILPYLRRTIAHWSDPRIQLVTSGAGRSAGRLMLNVSPWWSGTTSLISSALDSFTIEVEIEPLASIIPPCSGTLLIKMDVEGAECDVLAGLRGHEFSRIVVLMEHEHLSDAQLSQLAAEWRLAAIDAATGEFLPIPGGDRSLMIGRPILRDLVLIQDRVAIVEPASRDVVQSS